MTRKEWIISSVIVAAMTALPIIFGYILISLALSIAKDPSLGIAGMGIPGLLSVLFFLIILGLVAMVMSFFIKNRMYQKTIAIAGFAAALISTSSILLSLLMNILIDMPLMLLEMIVVIGLCLLIAYLYYRRQQS